MLVAGIGVGFLPPALASDRLRAAPPGKTTEAPDGVSRAELLSFDSGVAPALLAVPLDSQIRIEDWPVAPGLRRTLVVARHEVYAPDTRIVAIDEGREVEVPRSRLVFFWGAIEGDPESTAMIALDPEDRTLSGFATGKDGSFDLLPPAAERPGRHLVAASASLRPSGDERSFACGQSELPLGGERAEPGASRSAVEPELPASLHTAVLAIDTDNEVMGTKFSNNTTTAANWMAAAVAGMSALYERDVFVRFYQGYTIFRLSTTPDPYVQNAGGNADGAKLNEFSNYWAANYAGVKRTLSMMISGKQPGGGWSGIAWIGGLCSNSIGYSFNQVFRTGTSFGASDTQLLTHEVGHNFGSRHTHCTDTNPGSAGTQPIDYCYSGESCSTGPWTPNPGVSCPAPFSITPVNGGGGSINNVRGTLMSYCHLLSGCGVSNVFHPSTVNVLSPRIDAAIGACIFPLSANPAPAVAGITPVQGSTSGGTPVTITGTGFRSPASVVFADLGNAAAATSIVVVNSTTITAVTPAHAPGVTDVVVMNPDQQTGTLRLGYSYSAAPTVSSISPNAGTILGGTPVTIAGTNFVAPATVTIGGAPATGVNVASGTTITATTPAHAAGIVNVVVQTNGMSATLTNGYQYLTPPPASSFYTVQPCRLVDTRNPNGPRGGPAIAASARRDFTLTGVCGVPASAKAISVNLTVSGPAAAGFLKLFPGDGIAPLASSLNFSAGQTRGNNAIVLLATSGSGVLAVQNGSTGSLHFILDVNGYFQ
jgi:Metallo-peptidase family M12/IPT/TIG domain